MTGKRKTLWVVAAALALLMVWVAAPVDLVPRWISLGSYDRSGEGPFATTTHVTVPEGSVRDMVGLPVSDAKDRLRERGLEVYIHVVRLDRHSDLSDLMIRCDGVLLTVLLGRVVKAERPAET